MQWLILTCSNCRLTWFSICSETKTDSPSAFFQLFCNVLHAKIKKRKFVRLQAALIASKQQSALTLWPEDEIYPREWSKLLFFSEKGVSGGDIKTKEEEKWSVHFHSQCCGNNQRRSEALQTGGSSYPCLLILTSDTSGRWLAAEQRTVWEEEVGNQMPARQLALARLSNRNPSSPSWVSIIPQNAPGPRGRGGTWGRLCWGQTGWKVKPAAPAYWSDWDHHKQKPIAGNKTKFTYFP